MNGCRLSIAVLLSVALAVSCKKEEFTPDPKNVAAGKYVQGTSEYLKGNFDAALAAFAEVERNTPDDPRLPAAIGEVYLSQGKLSEALQKFQTASRLDSKRATTWSRIGFIQAQKGDLAAAKISLARAIELNPKDFNGHEQLAEIQLKENDRAGAVASYQAAAQSSPEPQQPELYLKAADILRKEDRVRDAIELLQAAAKSGANSADLEATLGELWVRQGNLDDADAAYRTAATLAPKDPGFWELVGQIEIERGKLDEAEAAYRESLRVKDRAIVHIQLAKLHLSQRDTVPAKQELDLALSAGANAGKDEPPESLEEALELVDLLESLGRKADALKLLTVLAAEPGAARNVELQRHTARVAAALNIQGTVSVACARVGALNLKPPAKCP